MKRNFVANILALVLCSLLIVSCEPPANSSNSLTTSDLTGNFTVPTAGRVNRYLDSALRSPSGCNNTTYTDTTGYESGTPVASNELEREYAKMGGSIKALKHAQCVMNRYKNTRFRGGHGSTRIKDQCKFAINEHANPQGRDRGTRGNKKFIVNQCTGEIKVMNVARGYNGIGQGTGKTTPGFHISGGWHQPYQPGHPDYKRWYPGIKMVGLQSGVNDEAWGRGVVMHRALTDEGNEYCSGGMKSSRNSSGTTSGDCGRSAGCPAVSSQNWQTVVNDLKGDDDGGVLIYNYTTREARQGDSYCGDNMKTM